MPDLSSTVALEFAGHFEDVAAKLHKWVDPLSSEQFWRNPYAYGNSAGHLVLHLTGSLSYYIGAQIAGSGYVRTAIGNSRRHRVRPRRMCCAPSTAPCKPWSRPFANNPSPIGTRPIPPSAASKKIVSPSC